jgi:hypothetical protein
MFIHSMTESIFVVGKAIQVFNFEFFRSIPDYIRMMSEIQHLKIIEIISDT